MVLIGASLRNEERGALHGLIKLILVGIPWKFYWLSKLDPHLHAIVQSCRRDDRIRRHFVFIQNFSQLLANPRRWLSLCRSNVDKLLHRILEQVRVIADRNIQIRGVAYANENRHYDNELQASTATFVGSIFDHQQSRLSIAYSGRS